MSFKIVWKKDYPNTRVIGRMTILNVNESNSINSKNKLSPIPHPGLWFLPKIIIEEKSWKMFFFLELSIDCKVATKHDNLFLYKRYSTWKYFMNISFKLWPLKSNTVCAGLVKKLFNRFLK